MPHSAQNRCTSGVKKSASRVQMASAFPATAVPSTGSSARSRNRFSGTDRGLTRVATPARKSRYSEISRGVSPETFSNLG